jgi:hypothetical protein
MRRATAVSVIGEFEAASGVFGEAAICGSTAGKSIGDMGIVGDNPSSRRWRGHCGALVPLAPSLAPVAPLPPQATLVLSPVSPLLAQGPHDGVQQSPLP